jgi:hypothetical protein
MLLQARGVLMLANMVCVLGLPAFLPSDAARPKYAPLGFCGRAMVADCGSTDVISGRSPHQNSASREESSSSPHTSNLWPA